jgi:putative oxidoreductase
MKVVYLVARLLLALVFVVFGLNGFLHFIPQPPPSGLAGQFVGALFVSHYLVVVFVLQLLSGILLLINRYVPLALTLLGPVIFNILLFHSFMNPEGLPLALIVTVLWLVTAWGVRSAFAGIFHQNVQPQ